MESKRIWDVEMDHSDFSTEGLATTVLGPCHGFIAILDQGQHVFIEYRSDDTYLQGSTRFNNQVMPSN